MKLSKPNNKGKLAAFACRAENSRGRFFEEPDSPTRSPYQRDRDRIVHSTAFRRLKHKTQVFVYHEGDHFRTRLTHSIEVSQIARALARAFDVDEDLAEALALSHDFGHTPFGHTGEEELDTLMEDWGGFDHNAQSLKIVTQLEKRYAEFDGLNLAWETVEGLVKHNGPVVDAAGEGLEGPVQQDILEYNTKWDLDLSRRSSLEAQCAAIADDIAYNAHDLDDGLRAGLFDHKALENLPLVGELLAGVHKKYPTLETSRVTHEIVRRQITAMVEDVILATGERLEALTPQSEEDIRNCDQTLVAFSPDMAKKEKAIKAFLFENMYRAPGVSRIRENAKLVVRDLFCRYMVDENAISQHWWEGEDIELYRQGEEPRARMVCDYLAGMTDRYAILEHKRLFDVTPDLG